MAEAVALTTEDYNKILQNKFQNPAIKFIKADLSPFSKNVQGLMGDHFKLKVTYELDNKALEEVFFLKTRIMKNSAQSDVLQDGLTYGKEVLMYDFLFKEFEKYDLDTSFSPTNYFCKGTETLIMENMLDKGYKMVERSKVFDMEHMQSVLEALATLHGNSFIYELDKSKELQKEYRLGKEFPVEFQENFFVIDPEEFGYKWFETSSNLWEKLIDLLPESEEYKKEFKNKLRATNLRNVFHEETNLRKICGHGDLWSNNILFKRLDNGKLKAILIDYQVIRYFYPSYDVLLLTYFNTDQQFRKSHLDEILLFYYETLSTILHKRGYDIANILPKEEFYKTLNLIEYQAIVQVYSCFTVTMLPPEILNSVVSATQTNFQDVMFKDRFDFVKLAMEKDENYKKIIDDCLKDLHDVLFK